MGSRKLAPQYYSQYQSAATSEVVKAPLSSIVSGAIQVSYLLPLRGDGRISTGPWTIPIPKEPVPATPHFGALLHTPTRMTHVSGQILQGDQIG